MKKRNAIVALLVCVLIVIAAVIGIAFMMPTENGKEEDGNTEDKEQVIQATDEIGTPFDMTNPIPDENYNTIVAYKASQVFQDENGLYKSEISVTMPQLTMRTTEAGMINEKLMEFFSEAYENGLFGGQENMGYQEEAEQESDDPYYYNYSYELEYGITLFNDKYLSVLAEGYEYVGGAHGMPFRISLIFNMETGEQVMGETLFAISEEEFKKQKVAAYRELIRQGEEGEYWEDALSIVEENTDFDSEYYLTKEGVTFFYHPYALAPYAAGYVEVTVPYEKLPVL